MAIVHLMIYTKTAELGYAAGENKNALNEIRSENRTLAAQAAREESLDRIEQIAKTRLKMVVPGKIRYILVTGESLSE